MVYYTEPTANDTTGLFEFFNYVNVTASGLFFPIMLLIVWVITFVAAKRYSSSRAWTLSSFICFILSVPLAIMNLIDPKFMYLLLLFVAVGGLWLKLET